LNSAGRVPFKRLIKAGGKRLARQWGYEIKRIPPPPTSLIYQDYLPGTPHPTYNPWNKDRSFQEAYALIQGFTMIDRYRCFELWKLVEQSAKLKHGHLIEIGVWRGGSGALIARQAKNCGIPDRVFLCDTFAGVVKAGPRDSLYQGGEHADATRQDVEGLVFNQLSLDNVEILEGVFPDQTGGGLEGLPFRFCHIDVDVYQSAKDIVDWIWDKIVPGGIVVYDDYGFWECQGITRYVEEQMGCPDRIIVHNLNGQAVVLKR
jgi:O-methyltransferase